MLVKYAGFSLFEELKLFMPSGLLADSRLQSSVHLMYFFVMILEYVCVLPFIEGRYYLILIHSRLHEKRYASFVVFMVLFLNHFYVLLFYFKLDLVMGAVICLSVIFNCYKIVSLKIKNGIMFVFINQAAVNLGIVIFMICCAFGDSIIDNKTGDLKYFTKRNSFDYALDIFVDDVDLNI